MRFALLALFLAACSSKPPAPEPEILPCYKAKTYKEFTALSKKHEKNSAVPLTVAGKKYACVESALVPETVCYVAKTKKEYAKLSRQQEKQPGWPVKIDKKYYNCIQETEVKKSK